MEEIITNSAEETEKLAIKLATRFTHKPLIIALSGELGAGKTVFTQGFAKGLKIKEKITSPTFVLIRHHQIPNTVKIFYHIDLYRLEDKNQINNLGLEDISSNPNHIVLIEWAERASFLLPKNTIKIKIEKLNQTSRKISVKEFPS